MYYAKVPYPASSVFYVCAFLWLFTDTYQDKFIGICLKVYIMLGGNFCLDVFACTRLCYTNLSDVEILIKKPVDNIVWICSHDLLKDTKA